MSGRNMSVESKGNTVRDRVQYLRWVHGGNNAPKNLQQQRWGQGGGTQFLTARKGSSIADERNRWSQLIQAIAKNPIDSYSLQLIALHELGKIKTAGMNIWNTGHEKELPLAYFAQKTLNTIRSFVNGAPKAFAITKAAEHYAQVGLKVVKYPIVAGPATQMFMLRELQRMFKEGRVNIFKIEPLALYLWSENLKALMSAYRKHPKA